MHSGKKEKLKEGKNMSKRAYNSKTLKIKYRAI